jgi:hypothetical protein
MPERIGIVTRGGDCPGLNAVIRAVVKATAHRGWESRRRRNATSTRLAGAGGLPSIVLAVASPWCATWRSP